LPLAASFVKDGYDVYGTTTSKEKCAELANKAINPFLIRLSEDGIDGSIANFLSKTTILIVNVPPKLRGNNAENYLQKIKLLHQAVKNSDVKKIIFVSSTSVYGDNRGEVTETTIPRPVTDSGKQLLACEDLFRSDQEVQTTIIRFGGLIGDDRHPVNFLSGKKGLSNGSAPINLIHQVDCIRIIKSIVKEAWWNELFNAVYPYHPSKKDYYTQACLKRNLPIPDYMNDTSQFEKCVRSYRLITVKGFRFNTSITD
tara:strand:+ start:113024 stop:113791 length:768 start_codon:yes stop_codon:yes gene_type:complete